MKPLDATRALDRLAELATDPATGPRFARWLEEPPMPKPATTPKAAEVQTGIRLPVSVIERADALAARFADDPVIAAMGPPSRSGVLRLAIALGLEVLERDPGRARPPPPDARTWFDVSAVNDAAGRAAEAVCEGHATVARHVDGAGRLYAVTTQQTGGLLLRRVWLVRRDYAVEQVDQDTADRVLAELPPANRRV